MSTFAEAITAGSKAQRKASQQAGNARRTTHTLWGPGGRVAGTATVRGPEHAVYRPLKGQKVTNPGDAGHDGMDPKAFKGAWPSVSANLNMMATNRRTFDRHGRKLVKVAAGTAAGTAATVTPLQNAVNREQTKQQNKIAARKGRAPVAKAMPRLRNLRNPFRVEPKRVPYSEAMPGVYQGSKTRGVHDVTSMDQGIPHGGHTKKAPPMERLGRFADKHAGANAMNVALEGGLATGGLVAVGTTTKTRRQRLAATKNAQARKAPVTKKLSVSPKKSDVGRWTAAIGAGSAIGGAAAYKVAHENKKKTGAAVVGGLAGQGAYQAVGYGVTHHVRSRTGQSLKRSELTEINNGTRPRGKLRADLSDKKGWEARMDSRRKHTAAHTVGGKTDWAGAYRSWPSDQPYYKATRAIGHTHNGRRGVALGAATTLAGAGLAAAGVDNHRPKPVDKMWKPKIKYRARKKVEAGLRSVIEPIDKPIVHHAMRAAAIGGAAGGTFGAAATGAVVGRKQQVTKGLYQRESRPSVLRAAEFGVGAGLAAWGAGRSRMLGVALGRGVKAASTRGDARALYALRQAQALQGVLRRGTAPGERHVRQIRSLNATINAIPASLRPEIATAAGLLLASNAHPVYRTHYRPVSTNVQFRRVF